MPETEAKRGKPEWMNDPEKVAAANAKRAAKRAASQAGAVAPAQAAEPASAPARGRKRAAAPVEPEPGGEPTPESIAGMLAESEDQLVAAHAAVAEAEAQLVKAETYRDRMIAFRSALADE